MNKTQVCGSSAGKESPAMWETPVGFQEDLLQKGQATHSTGKESGYNAGDLCLIPGLGRSSGEEKDHPLQYSGPENSMDCVFLEIPKSDMIE